MRVNQLVEPSGSSVQRLQQFLQLSGSLKKAVPLASAVLQDSERKCQAGFKEEQERWSR